MAPLAGVEVFPAEIQLTTARDRQSIVVQATFADGITRDVTGEATIEPGRPQAGAAGRSDVLSGGRRRHDPVGRVRRQVGHGAGQGRRRRPSRRRSSFRLDVMPVFMRSGCNTGSCHGAARGKDGFRISLFGFDPDGDYFRLTREMVGRRINLAVPSDSTLLSKATGAVNHTGGKRFESSSELYQTVHGWIEAGAPNDDASQAAQGGGRRSLSPAQPSSTARARPSSSPRVPATPMGPTATSPAWPFS